MGFLQVLHQFENEIINNVCKEVRPEDMLTKTYIANAFLEFVKNLEVAKKVIIVIVQYVKIIRNLKCHQILWKRQKKES